MRSVTSSSPLESDVGSLHETSKWDPTGPEASCKGMAEVSGVRLGLYRAHANDSEHVGREVAKAFSLGSAVIPFRIEAVNPREKSGIFP